jgi:ABC-type sugar transport system ATPase subunit
MIVGERVAVLKDGVLQHVYNPLALYDNPANLFVASFIGSPAMNRSTPSPPSTRRRSVST